MTTRTAEDFYNEGVDAGNAKQYQEALSLFTKAIELDENYAAAYNNRGLAKEKLKNYEEAINDYTKAIELDENYAKAYLNRGDTWKHIPLTGEEKRSRAISDFNQALNVSKGEYMSALETVRGYQGNNQVKKLYDSRMAFLDIWIQKNDLPLTIKMSQNYFDIELKSGQKLITLIWEIIANHSLKKINAPYPDLEYFLQSFFVKNVYLNVSNKRQLSHTEFQAMALLFYVVDQPEHTFYILDYILDERFDLDIIDHYLFIQSAWQILSTKSEIISLIKDAQNAIVQIVPKNSIEKQLKEEILAIDVKSEELFEKSEFYPYYSHCNLFAKKEGAYNANCNTYEFKAGEQTDYDKLRVVLLPVLCGECKVIDVLQVSTQEQEKYSKILIQQSIEFLIEAYCENNLQVCERLEKMTNVINYPKTDDEFSKYISERKITTNNEVDFELIFALVGYTKNIDWDKISMRLQYIL